MLRYVFTAFLIGHGLAHLSGFLAAWTRNASGYSESPWIFSNTVALQSPIGRAFGLLWLLALVGFVGAGLGLFSGQDWWPALAVPAAGVSLAVIVPWWNTVPPGAWFGAAFNVLVIITPLLPIGDQILDLVQ
jgi:hypothetical protein